MAPRELRIVLGRPRLGIIDQIILEEALIHPKCH